MAKTTTKRQDAQAPDNDAPGTDAAAQEPEAPATEQPAPEPAAEAAQAPAEGAESPDPEQPTPELQSGPQGPAEAGDGVPSVTIGAVGAEAVALSCVDGVTVYLLATPDGLTPVRAVTALEAALAEARSHLPKVEPARPTREELVRTLAERPWAEVEVTYLLHGFSVIAGLQVDGTPRRFPLQRVAEYGPEYMRALAEAPEISVRFCAED